MKVYLAGPMRGYTDNNYPAFHNGAALLRAQGYEVFSPAENARPTIRECLAVDLDWICREAEMVVFLPGWEASLGVAAERATANALGIPVMTLDKALELHSAQA